MNEVIKLENDKIIKDNITKKEAMFFSNEEHNLMVVLPHGKISSLLLIFVY